MKKISDIKTSDIYDEKYFEDLKMLEENGDFIGRRRLEFGKYMVLLRQNIGFSQQDIAKKLGIRRESWNRIENGIRLPDKKHLNTIADLFKTSSENLYQRCGYPYSREYPDYDLEEVVEELRKAFVNSDDLPEFMVGAQSVWNEYRVVSQNDYETDRELNTKYTKQIQKYFDINIANLSIYIGQMTPSQRMSFVKAILLGDYSISTKNDDKAKKIQEEIFNQLKQYYEK